MNYDPNGNIFNYNRNGSPTIPGKQSRMDELTYFYKTGSNQLDHVEDAVSSSYYSEDIDGQSAGHYGYDLIGNLIKDDQTTIRWNVYGKIKQVIKPGNETISYTYDAAGNRITKTTPDGKTLVYVRDASGDVMSVYEKAGSATMVQAEIHLYGSSRLGLTGVLTEAVAEQTTDFTVPAWKRTFTRGEKIFELSNHLGNVLSTISDRREQVDGSGVVAYYNANVRSATDYYPFGMGMVGRSYAAGGYRYGFNGQEKTPEINDDGYTAEFWQYDARIGRRRNADPVVKPEVSPYLVLGNNPIYFVDKKGDDWFVNNLGFYIWSDDASVMEKGFTQYAGTSLPSSVSQYKILTYITTETNVGKVEVLYHKYRHSGFKKLWKSVFGGKDMVTNKEYSAHDEMMSEEYVGMAIGYGVFKAAGVAFQVFKAAGGSIWQLPGWIERGFVYEAMKGKPASGL